MTLNNSSGKYRSYSLITKTNSDSIIVAEGKVDIQKIEQFSDSINNLGFSTKYHQEDLRGKAHLDLNIKSYSFSCMIKNDSIFSVELVPALTGIKENRTFDIKMLYTKLSKQELDRKLKNYKNFYLIRYKGADIFELVIN
ncbi:MAG: hypothetical protein ACXVNN_07985, partial [Bacteroidia bacterium]